MMTMQPIETIVTIEAIQSGGVISSETRIWSHRRIAAGLARAWAWLMWQSEKSRTRIALSELTDSQLDDIGVTRAEARREACQSFWN